MYTLTPHSHLSNVPRLPRTCRATATSPARTSTADPPRHLPLTTTITTPVTANDSSLRSTWAHRAWVASGFASVLTSLAKSVSAAVDSGSAFEPLLAAFLGYILADLGTGVYHWAIDNYGGPSTPIFGPQIEAFQGHHRWPWTITRREFANNLHALARAVTFAVMPIEFFATADDAAVHAFVGACAGCVVMSQKFHAWAHGTKSRLPPVVRREGEGKPGENATEGGWQGDNGARRDRRRTPPRGGGCVARGERRREGRLPGDNAAGGVAGGERAGRGGRGRTPPQRFRFVFLCGCTVLYLRSNLHSFYIFISYITS